SRSASEGCWTRPRACSSRSSRWRAAARKSASRTRSSRSSACEPSLVAMDLPPLKLDADGLITVVAQDRATGEVRMVGHASEEAVRLTAETGLAHFYSRSRQRLWKKGEESGNTLAVSAIWLDCDADAAVYLVDPAGPTCHTGAPSCFFQRLHPARSEAKRASPIQIGRAACRGSGSS